MSDYIYKLNDDQTQLTVTCPLDPATARMHWPATADVSRKACILAGRPVRCEVAEAKSDTEYVYSVAPEAHPVTAAEAAYRIAAEAQLALENRLLLGRYLDDETPAVRVWSQSIAWRVASAETNKAHQIYQAMAAGYRDGIEWARENPELKPTPGGWDEACINALGAAHFGRICGLSESEVSDRGEAWRAVCDAYNRGGEAGVEDHRS